MIIQIYFLDRSEAQSFADASASLGTIQIDLVEEQSQDWNAAWKESFEGLDIGDAWKIRPPWKSLNVSDDPTGLVIDPGMGFGTGSHPTTHLCLEWLSKAPILEGSKVLDFGAGSGILSIASYKKGAHEVHAVEIDEDARASCKRNIQLNACEAVISVSEQIPEGGTYDLILGNILSHVLKDFASILVRALKPKGQLVLSGFFEEDEKEILEAYRVASNGHLKRIGAVYRDSWVCLILG